MSDLSQKKSTSAESDVAEPVEIEAKFTHSSSANATNVKPGNKALWFICIINLLFVLGLGAAIYWAWHQYQTLANTEENKFDQVTQQINALSQTSKYADNTIIDKQSILSKNVESMLEELQASQQVNQALQQQLAEVSGRRPSDWLLAEADYLVNLAGRKLYLEKDVRTAITLLSEADARIEDLNDPSLFPVRTLIAADIAALEQINQVSVTSIALAIGGMLPQVSELPLNNFTLPEAANDEDLELSSDIADWRENLSRTWKSIVGDFISVKATDAPIEPYLAERQQWLIEQQLKHALSRAQSAALSEQITLFQQNIQEAIALIIEHYKLNTPNVEQYLGALQQLLATNFERQYPDKLQSQSLLKETVKQRVNIRFDRSSSEGTSL